MSLCPRVRLSNCYASTETCTSNIADACLSRSVQVDWKESLNLDNTDATKPTPLCPIHPSPLCLLSILSSLLSCFAPCTGLTCSGKLPLLHWHVWESSGLPASVPAPCFMVPLQQSASAEHMFCQCCLPPLKRSKSSVLSFQRKSESR